MQYKLCDTFHIVQYLSEWFLLNSGCLSCKISNMFGCLKKATILSLYAANMKSLINTNKFGLQIIKRVWIRDASTLHTGYESNNTLITQMLC